MLRGWSWPRKNSSTSVSGRVRKYWSSTGRAAATRQPVGREVGQDRPPHPHERDVLVLEHAERSSRGSASTTSTNGGSPDRSVRMRPIPENMPMSPSSSARFRPLSGGAHDHVGRPARAAEHGAGRRRRRRRTPCCPSRGPAVEAGPHARRTVKDLDAIRLVGAAGHVVEGHERGRAACRPRRPSTTRAGAAARPRSPGPAATPRSRRTAPGGAAAAVVRRRASRRTRPAARAGRRRPRAVAHEVVDGRRRARSTRRRGGRGRPGTAAAGPGRTAPRRARPAPPAGRRRTGVTVSSTVGGGFDVLGRLAVDHGDARAQTLVAVDELGQGGPQGAFVGRPAKRCRAVMLYRPGGSAVVSRRHICSWASDSGKRLVRPAPASRQHRPCAGAGLGIDEGRQAGEGRLLEDGPQRRARAELLPHLGDDLGGQERVPTEVEEVVVGAEDVGVEAQDRRPDGGHPVLGRRARTAGAGAPGRAQEARRGRPCRSP